MKKLKEHMKQVKDLLEEIDKSAYEARMMLYRMDEMIWKEENRKLLGNYEEKVG